MVRKIGKLHIGQTAAPSMAVETPDPQRDSNSVNGKTKRRFTVDKRAYEVYPWDNDNLLPNRMIDLYRTNGDVMNLVQTRVDFMYGAGPGWYKHKKDGKDLILEPFENSETILFGQINDVPDIVNTGLTYYAETGNSFINLSAGEEKHPVLTVRDTLTCRAVVAKGLSVDTWLLASDWRDPKTPVPVPAWDKTLIKAPETLYQIKGPQSGQFYYGFPRWWSTEDWIKLANRVPKFHNKGLDTEYNVSKICRINQDFFERFGGQTKKAQEKFKDKFYSEIETMLISGDGGRRVIFDECTTGPDGKLQPWIEFETIQQLLTGKEYSELYQMAVLAFANASGILAGLVGVNDGKMLGGSGSELRVSAEYQQFYRTPRDRQGIISFFDRAIKPLLGLPDDVHFGFGNILLETLDKNKSGSSTRPTSQK